MRCLGQLPALEREPKDLHTPVTLSLEQNPRLKALNARTLALEQRLLKARRERGPVLSAALEAATTLGDAMTETAWVQLRQARVELGTPLLSAVVSEVRVHGGRRVSRGERLVLLDDGAPLGARVVGLGLESTPQSVGAQPPYAVEAALELPGGGRLPAGLPVNLKVRRLSLDDRVCLRCLVGGRVQGVFFRATTRSLAQRLAISGSARNLSDGRVEVVACGPAHAVQELRDWLHQGPIGARVTGVTCEQLPLQDLYGFVTG